MGILYAHVITVVISVYCFQENDFLFQLHIKYIIQSKPVCVWQFLLRSLHENLDYTHCLCFHCLMNIKLQKCLVDNENCSFCKVSCEFPWNYSWILESSQPSSISFFTLLQLLEFKMCFVPVMTLVSYIIFYFFHVHHYWKMMLTKSLSCQFVSLPFLLCLNLWVSSFW